MQGEPTSEIHNAPIFVIIRGLSHFLLKEKQRKRGFWWNQAEISKFVKVCQWILCSFWRMFWLLRPLHNFLKAGDTCSRYLEGVPTSGLHNALTFVIIRCLSHFLLKEKQRKRDYWWNQPEMSKFVEVYQWILSRFWWFLADVLTSEATRKFSEGRRHMCKVSRRCAYIRALQRTYSRGHTTSQSFFILSNSPPPPVACFGNTFFIWFMGSHFWPFKKAFWKWLCRAFFALKNGCRDLRQLLFYVFCT